MQALTPNSPSPHSAASTISTEAQAFEPMQLTFPSSSRTPTLFSLPFKTFLKLDMGITDLFADIMASVGFQEAHAEAPAEEEDDKDEGGEEGGEEKSEESGDEEEQTGGDEGGDEEGGAEEEVEEEAEEEEDEPVDLKPKLEAGQSNHPPPLRPATASLDDPLSVCMLVPQD